MLCEVFWTASQSQCCSGKGGATPPDTGGGEHTVVLLCYWAVQLMPAQAVPAYQPWPLRLELSLDDQNTTEEWDPLPRLFCPLSPPRILTDH